MTEGDAAGEAPLDAAATKLRRGEADPVTYATERLDRITAVDPDVRAFVEVDRDRALAAAGALAGDDTGPAARPARSPSADPWARPPLFGVPVGVKDIFHVEGLPTRAGSTLPPAVLAGSEGTAIRRLRDAGAYVLGKTVTAEFAYFEPGPTRNPHALGHTPGGSSSGSAAAVAAGEVPLALGTQTVGSVVRPAAFCGVVGFKPSYGRVPTDGVLPFSPSVDHVGTFTAGVAGARLAASALCDAWDDGAARTARPVIGVPEGDYLDRADETGRDAFEAATAALSRTHDVRRLELDLSGAYEHHDPLIAAELALSHGRWYDEYGDRYADQTAALIERGRETSVEAVIAGRRSRRAVRDRVTERMREAGVDLLACPAAPGPAPEGIDSTGDPRMNLPWTHAGTPVVALPAGRVDGLPVGVQFVAPHGADEALLAAAPGLASALPSGEVGG